MKYGLTFFVVTKAKMFANCDGISDVQLADDLNNKSVAVLRGTFTAEDLRILADCLENKTEIRDHFKVTHVE